jgi:RES domain-containing protein
MLEVFVHLNKASSGKHGPNYIITEIATKDISLKYFYTPKLKKNWRKDKSYTQEIGTEFEEMDDKTILKIPSVIVPFAYNFVMKEKGIFIHHLEEKQVAPLYWDHRLFD